jgi:uncharacterized protein (DUF433 family)
MSDDNDWRKYIECDEDILGGEPVVKGTRITVSVVVGSLADGMTEDEILDAYPQLERDDIRACLRYAAESAQDDIRYGMTA